MPVAAPALSSAILSQMSFKQMTGKDASRIAGAVGSSLAGYLVIPNLVTCSLAGTAGLFGDINSLAVLGLVPSVMSNLMQSKALSLNLTGKDAIRLFNAVSFGTFQVLQTMVLTGTTVGCAVGAGFGTFTAVNEQALSKLMLQQMLSKNLTGRDAINLCDCISFGIVNHLRTSVKFSVVVKGAIAPTPPTGPVPVTNIPSVFTKVN